MSYTLLAIDIGNTTTECGIFQGESLAASWRLASGVERTADEFRQLIHQFCREAGFAPDRFDDAAIASVVPNRTRAIAQAIQSARWSPLIISMDSCPFLDVRLANPRQVGADRLCNAYAGFHLFGGPLIAVDFGTAITLDVVSFDGGYLGGVILPGPLTTAASLHRRTAQLPSVSLEFPEEIVGRDTDHAIQTGLTWGVVDMVDGLIKRLARELDCSPRVIATGGLAAPYAERSAYFHEVYPDLVLDGIRLIHARARGIKVEK